MILFVVEGNLMRARYVFPYNACVCVKIDLENVRYFLPSLLAFVLKTNVVLDMFVMPYNASVCDTNKSSGRKICCTL